jgi:hypothetical protein
MAVEFAAGGRIDGRKARSFQVGIFLQLKKFSPACVPGTSVSHSCPYVLARTSPCSTVNSEAIPIFQRADFSFS